MHRLIRTCVVCKLHMGPFRALHIICNLQRPTSKVSVRLFVFINTVYSIQWLLVDSEDLIRLCWSSMSQNTFLLALVTFNQDFFFFFFFHFSPRKHVSLIQTFSKKVIHIQRFLFLHKKNTLRHIMEAPHQGASNEYPQHMFSLRKKKKAVCYGWKELIIWGSEIWAGAISVIHNSLELSQR